MPGLPPLERPALADRKPYRARGRHLAVLDDHSVPVKGRRQGAGIRWPGPEQAGESKVTNRVAVLIVDGNVEEVAVAVAGAQYPEGVDQCLPPKTGNDGVPDILALVSVNL